MDAVSADGLGDQPTVRAAGGVVWRPGPNGKPEVLLVHRPAYDDWSMPKGKREVGETDEACAVREIEEETGLRAELGTELTTVAYIDHKGRPKVVRYWTAMVVGGAFEPNQEVDEVRWLTVPRASDLLSYDRDRELLRAFLRAWAKPRHPSNQASRARGAEGSRRLSADEWRAFLLDPPRPGVLATIRADGRPHAVPVWFDLDGEAIVFNTGAESVKGVNLARDPRATLCVQDDRPPYSFVTVEGVVELVDDLAVVRAWATRLGGRYMGEGQAERFGARNGVPGELLVRLTPTRTVFARDVAG